MESEKKLYTYVYRMILTDIFNGIYSYNDKLPTLLELCEIYNVGRNTVRTALLTLQDDGYIALQRGTQARVKLDHGNEQLHQQYKQVLIDSRDMLSDVFETMSLLFPYIGSMSLRNATPEQILFLKQQVHNFDVENIQSEEQIIKELFSIYETGFSFLNNPVINDVVETLLYSIYYPSFTGKSEKLEKTIKQIQSTVKMIIKAFETGNEFIIKNLIKILCYSLGKLLINYIDRTCEGMTPQKPKDFIWLNQPEDEYLYMKVVFQIILDIHNQVYKTNDLLPSIAQISEKYNVSDRTSRRALKALNDFSIIKTINGVGSKVIVKKIGGNKRLLKKPEIKKNVMNYFYSAELLTYLNSAVFPSILASIPQEELKALAIKLQDKEHYSLTDIYDFVYSHSNSCVYTIYKQLESTRVWGVFAGLFIKYSREEVQDMREGLLTALKEKDTHTIYQIVQDMMNISVQVQIIN